MFKNVTLRLDEVILKDARRVAVENDQSLSRWMADLITKEISHDEYYIKARKRALKRLRKGLPLGGRPVSRELLHERG